MLISKQELAYILRRVELNGRAATGGENPWSIRQTAIYHKFSRNRDAVNGSSNGTAPASVKSKSMFLLIAPSENAESQFSKCLEQSILDDGLALSPWNVQRILVADSLRGWMDYMGSLEQRLKEQVSSRISECREREKKKEAHWADPSNSQIASFWQQWEMTM